LRREGNFGGWKLASAFVVCGTLLALAPAAAEAGGNAHSSIVGGKVASILAFPSLAYIDASNRRGEGFACTGTVIAPRVVLTAAHCVEDLERGGYTPAPEYLVATGLANPHQAHRADLLRVADTRVFPEFDPGTLRGDAAILILASPTDAPAIPLATTADATLYEGGATVLLAGWGLLRADSASPPRNLRSTSTVVLDPASCKRRTRAFNPLYSPALQMCATNPPDHKTGGCFGDSGGPAIGQRADGSAVEVGITSTGGPGCSTTLPNIFTRTDRVSTWASEWIAATEAGAPPPALGPARLPLMRRESAKGFVIRALVDRFGVRFLGSERVSGSCRRVSRASFRCGLGWRFGRNVYRGTVVVYYASRRDAVVWDKRLRIHRSKLPSRLR
jgi:secreted trypsin-like serine protease